jgi:REP element-mobilizing transposase RayT
MIHPTKETWGWQYMSVGTEEKSEKRTQNKSTRPHRLVSSYKINNIRRIVMRKRRELVMGAKYHVISRANRKEMIFTSHHIKELFMDVVRSAKKKYRFTISNFCIMGNHFHLIIQPLENQNLSKIMQWILSVFAKRYNKVFNLTGHVWHDRFTSKVIRSFYQYLITFIYIANNPVRANISSNPIEYEYNGISFLQKGILDILERPPNSFLTIIWKMLNQRR